MSRLSRLSARDYRRLTPEQRQAADRLLHGHLMPEGLTLADKGEAKTILGWRRTAAETRAYGKQLIENGMMLSAAAGRLGVEPDHLRRLLKEAPEGENPARKASTHPAKPGLTGKSKVVGRLAEPHPDAGRAVYGGDPFGYDFAAALARARP